MKDISRLLPFKQQLILEMAPKLDMLIQKFPSVSYCIDDRDLGENMGDVLEKLGMHSYPISGKDIKACYYRLLKAVKDDHLIFLNYRKKIDGSTSVSLLTELAQKAPHHSLRNVIPIYFSTTTSEKEQEVLQLLSRLGVQYVIFLSSQSSAEEKLRRLFEELRNFQKTVLEEGGAGESPQAELPEAEVQQNSQIKKYKELIAQGEKLMATDPAAAIAFFTEAIDLNPDFSSLMKRGDAYFKIREYYFALKDYQEANRLDQSRSDPFAKIGMCCFALVKTTAKSGEVANAKKWFARGLASLRKASTMIEEQGSGEKPLPVYAQRDLYTNVISALSEADFRGMGLEGEESQVSDLMDEVFYKVKEMDFSGPQVEVNSRIDFAILLTRKKQYHDAERIFRSIINDDPKSVGPAFNNYAVELRKNGEFGKAFLTYMELLRYEIPDRDIVTKNLITAGRKYALQMRNEAKVDEAINTYKNILVFASSTEGKEWVLCDLAKTYLEIDDQLQACSRLMEAVFLDPLISDREEFKNYPELRRLKEDMVKKLTRHSG